MSKIETSLGPAGSGSSPRTRGPTGRQGQTNLSAKEGDVG